jgi:phage baseplate assembly protein W
MAGEHIGSGWSYPLGLGATGDFALASGIRKLEQSMRLILLTYPGERVMRPEFGSLLRDFVFESATSETIGRLRREVRSALERWEPRAEINDVTVAPDEAATGLLHIDIAYTETATGEQGNLAFPLYTLPEPLPEPGSARNEGA